MCDPDDAVRSDRAACLGTGLVAYQGEDQRIRATDNLPFMLIFYFSVYYLEDGASYGAACAMLAWIEGAARACVPCRPNWFILHYAPSRFVNAFLLMRGGFYLLGL